MGVGYCGQDSGGGAPDGISDRDGMEFQTYDGGSRQGWGFSKVIGYQTQMGYQTEM